VFGMLKFVIKVQGSRIYGFGLKIKGAGYKDVATRFTACSFV